jgi:hypothetical protein
MTKTPKDEDGITLCIYKSEKIHTYTIKLIKKLCKNPGVIICATRPADSIISELKKKKISTKNLFFIELHGKSTIPNAMSVQSQEALTELSIAISQALQSLPGKNKFLIFEGISTLTTSNSSTTVQRFVQFLTAKCRSWAIDTHLLTDNNTESGLLAILKQDSDKVET